MERDLGLMEAMTFLDAHMTPEGYPDWIATDSDTMGEWEVKSVMNYAADAIGTARDIAGDDVSPHLRWSVQHKPAKPSDAS
jgi:hypothetical protein